MAHQAILLIALLRGVGGLLGKSWPVEGHPKAGFGQDLFQGGWLWTHASPQPDWPKGVQKQVGVHGNNRAYLVEDYVPKDWATASPLSLNLLGKTVSYTVDMTKVPCGVVACLYFVQNQKADSSSNYCDIQTNGCFELDIMEANSVAWETSTHVQTGKDFDGTCNEMGCSNNVGRYPYMFDGRETHKLYGPGAAIIDTRMLFQVRADVSTDGYMTVTLSQNGNRSLTVYNRTLSGNLPDISDEDAQDWKGYPKQQGVPADAAAKTVQAMKKGVRLVLSVWSTADTHWLDESGCSRLQPPTRGTAAGSDLVVYDLKIEPTPAPARGGAAAASDAEPDLEIRKYDARVITLAGVAGHKLAVAGAVAGLLAAAVGLAVVVARGRSTHWGHRTWTQAATPLQSDEGEAL